MNIRIKYIVLFFGFLIHSIGIVAQVKQYQLKVEKSYPHDVTAYTQGLFIHDGILYESTGQYGESSFRKVDLETGKVLSYTSFNKRYFVEGSCVFDDRLYILTWMENTCFVYDFDRMKKIGELRYNGEGWGLTSDGKSLIMSDGTAFISFRNPNTFMEERRIEVKYGGQSAGGVNELEYINGEIWANIYTTDYIVIIDPKTGNITGRIDCRNLLPNSLRRADTDVLNGIALDEKTGDIYLTGKKWPRLYKVSLIEK